MQTLENKGNPFETFEANKGLKARDSGFMPIQIKCDCETLLLRVNSFCPACKGTGKRIIMYPKTLLGAAVEATKKAISARVPTIERV